MPILLHEKFETSTATDTGGATGSMRVKMGDAHYQLKDSIVNADWLRRVKAGGTDRENFGEVIASAMGQAALPTEEDTELSPEVSLVYNSDHTIGVASKYLNEATTSLKGIELDKYRRITFDSSDDAEEISLKGEDNTLLRQDLANAIALSALVGDHDINPGNILAIKDGEGRDRIARIDFGHAFNDLLNAPEWCGGKVRNTENTIMDYFNREEVAHIKSSHRETKLWKSYSGMIPSSELATALEDMAAKHEQLAGALQVASLQFQGVAAMDPKLHSHIKTSLAAISNNLTGEELDTSKPVTEVITNAFKTLTAFSNKQCEQMKDVSRLMRLQVEIDKGLTAPTARVDQVHVLKEVKALSGKAGIEKEGKIQWLKTDRNTPAFSGTTQEYIAHRKTQLIAQRKIAVVASGKAHTADKMRNSVQSTSNTIKQSSTRAHAVAARSTTSRTR